VGERGSGCEVEVVTVCYLCILHVQCPIWLVQYGIGEVGGEWYGGCLGTRGSVFCLGLC
jgi:hypothetical protein